MHAQNKDNPTKPALGIDARPEIVVAIKHCLSMCQWQPGHAAYSGSAGAPKAVSYSTHSRLRQQLLHTGLR
jgi:hypothetical protein